MLSCSQENALSASFCNRGHRANQAFPAVPFQAYGQVGMGSVRVATIIEFQAASAYASIPSGRLRLGGQSKMRHL